MKAILPKQYVSNGRNYGNEKEMVDTWNVIGYRKGELQNVVTVRCYMGRSNSASVVYASIWVRAGETCAGHGSAGGYGYHKASAAIDEAIRSAGIELRGSAYGRETEDLKQRTSISGVGDSAIDTALRAIAAAAGYRKVIVVRN